MCSSRASLIPVGVAAHVLGRLFPDEWENFCERRGLLSTTVKMPPAEEKALMRWASDRSQVLSRTVRGVMRYGEALRLLARLEGMPEEDVEMVVASKFEFVVTCQKYSDFKKSKNPEDRWKGAAIDDLRKQFSHNLRVAYVDTELSGDQFSVLLGYDADAQQDRILFKVKLPGNPIIGEGKPENQNHAIIFTRGEHLQTLDMNQDNYMGEAFKMRNML